MGALRYIFILLSVCLAIGCTEYLDGAGSYVEKNVMLSLSSVPMRDQDSKAVNGTVDESSAEIKDFWIFQYNRNGALIGRPAYYRVREADKQQVSILVPSEPGDEYTTVFLANTHNNGLDMILDYGTLSDLTSSHISVSSSSDMYQRGYNDLLLSGYVKVDNATESVSCSLYRNVAKLKLNILNDEASGIVIKSVQLKNVNSKLFYADVFHRDKTNFPATSDVTFVSFEKDDFNLEQGGKKSLVYYLPRNMRGISDADTQPGKNDVSPPYSTYIEVMAEHAQRHTPVRYIFYLGKDNTKDYNVEPNYLYNVNLHFDGMGDVDDSRVEDLGVVTLADANSYIIQPLDGIGTRYMVPVKERINKFWSSDQGKINSDRWQDYLIGDKEWIAEVVWQDAAGKQVIKFCQDDGTLSDFYYGGVEGTSFSFVPTQEAVNTPCNVLIGVRSAEDDWSAETDGYMWSWHVWLTSYNPDENVGGWKDGQFSYQVQGGSVHKYASFEAMPMYDGKFMMDRNLGATKYQASPAITNEEVKEASGMYYEYGRKDPFPGRKMYDIHGNPKSFGSGSEVDGYGVQMKHGPAAIYVSVMKPYLYYTRNPVLPTNDWVVQNSLAGWDWNDLDKSAKDGNGKSFFDPCPPGWKIPRPEVMESFGNKEFVYASNCVDWQNLDLNKTGSSNYRGWLIYLSGEEGWNQKSGDVAYFPTSSHRAYEKGDISDTRSGIGGLWMVTADPSDGDGVYLYYSNTAKLLFRWYGPYHRQLGWPVRCIQE